MILDVYYQDKNTNMNILAILSMMIFSYCEILV